MDETAEASATGLRGDERWTDSWADLVDLVVRPGLCTGCSGCVVACPRKVLSMDSALWQPRLAPEAWAEGNSESCVFTERGCTMCTRACPRFGTWESDADLTTWGRPRRPEEVIGMFREILLVRATDEQISAAGQDGGMATAMLAYALENDIIDAALVSYVDAGQRARPGVATTRAELISAAGSRYTYSPTTLALADAIALEGVERIGLVAVGCQASIAAVSNDRGARRVARRLTLTIGLLCSKTFDERIYSELILKRYGLPRSAITKANIKGKLQLWTGPDDRAEPDLEISLKECEPFQRAGCNHCPDFSAQHADISLGGIGKHPKTTVAIVRSRLAADLVQSMESDGWITARDAEADDPAALRLITKLAAGQRRRWAASPSAVAHHPEPGMTSATTGE